MSFFVANASLITVADALPVLKTLFLRDDICGEVDWPCEVGLVRMLRFGIHGLLCYSGYDTRRFSFQKVTVCSPSSEDRIDNKRFQP